MLANKIFRMREYSITNNAVTSEVRMFFSYVPVLLNLAFESGPKTFDSHYAFFY